MEKTHLFKKKNLLLFLILTAFLVLFYIIANQLQEKNISPEDSSASAIDDEQKISELEKSKVISASDPYNSQYAPWVVVSSLNSNLDLYYCKNSEIGGIWRNRIWRIKRIDSTWSQDMMILDGVENTDEDLLCSPSILTHQGTWHMYYLSQNRNNQNTFLQHATSTDFGQTWTKLGPISGITQPFTGYIDTPSAYLNDGIFDIYYVGTDGDLYIISSPDGQVFNQEQKLTSGLKASNGRITVNAGIYYFVFAKDSKEADGPPTDFYLMVSKDGKTFSNSVVFYSSQTNEWDEGSIWSPQLVFENNILKIYFAGNKNIEYGSPGASTELGVLTIDIPTSVLDGLLQNLNETSAIECGVMDSNMDNKFDISDFTHFREVYNNYCIKPSSQTPNSYGYTDSNNDGFINIYDFAMFVEYYIQSINQ